MGAISVMVPTYCRPHYIRESIESILSQTLKPAQLIVVDNGLSPETRGICESYDGVEYLQSSPAGKSHACNFGLNHVKGEYLWIFDDDDVAAPDALETLVEPLLNGEYDFSYSSFWKIGNSMAEPLGLYRIPDFKEDEFFTALLKDNFISGASLFARTGCYREAGGCDPRLRRSQDYDLARRIARKFRGIRIDHPTYFRREHQNEKGQGPEAFDVSEKYRTWLEYDQVIFRRLYSELPLYEYT